MKSFFSFTLFSLALCLAMFTSCEKELNQPQIEQPSVNMPPEFQDKYGYAINYEIKDVGKIIFNESGIALADLPFAEANKMVKNYTDNFVNDLIAKQSAVDKSNNSSDYSFFSEARFATSINPDGTITWEYDNIYTNGTPLNVNGTISRMEIFLNDSNSPRNSFREVRVSRAAGALIYDSSAWYTSPTTLGRQSLTTFNTTSNDYSCDANSDIGGFVWLNANDNILTAATLECDD